MSKTLLSPWEDKRNPDASTRVVAVLMRKINEQSDMIV
jgi:hypothetical protein